MLFRPILKLPRCAARKGARPGRGPGAGSRSARRLEKQATRLPLDALRASPRSRSFVDPMPTVARTVSAWRPCFRPSVGTPPPPGRTAQAFFFSTAFGSGLTAPKRALNGRSSAISLLLLLKRRYNQGEPPPPNRAAGAGGFPTLIRYVSFMVRFIVPGVCSDRVQLNAS